jgi:3-methylcrotonyl-CoA carboxylase alpha subunit
VETGDSITMHYDPMIAKLTVHAETRSLALARLQQALNRYLCAGPTTNLQFLKWIAHRPEFLTGQVDIGFIERAWLPPEKHAPPAQGLIAAALADVAGAATAKDPWRGSSAWRTSGFPRRIRYQYDDDIYEVTLTSLGNSDWHSTAQGLDIQLSLIEVRPGLVIFRVGNSMSSVGVSERPNGYVVVYEGIAYQLRRPRPSDSDNPGAARHAVDSNLSAPMPGTIVSISVAEGQSVEPGEPLVIMEAMKMEHVVEAVAAGTVKAILVQPGEMVAAGTVLVKMDA